MVVCPAKTQISLGIRPVWSESSLSAWRKVGSLATHRLIWVFAGRTVILLVLSCRGSKHAVTFISRTRTGKAVFGKLLCSWYLDTLSAVTVDLLCCWHDRRSNKKSMKCHNPHPTHDLKTKRTQTQCYSFVYPFYITSLHHKRKDYKNPPCLCTVG